MQCALPQIEGWAFWGNLAEVGGRLRMFLQGVPPAVWRERRTHFGVAPSDFDLEAELDVAARLASTDPPVLSRNLAQENFT